MSETAPTPSPSAVRRIGGGSRLYVRIYLAVLASLAITALLTGAVIHGIWEPVESDLAMAALVDAGAAGLPPATAPAEAQRAALQRWQRRPNESLALYAADGSLVASVGHPLPPRDLQQTESGWLEGHPPVFALRLPDDRWLLLERMRRPPRGSPLGWLAATLLIALAVGVGAYPIIRRLTGRLERLQASVELWGDGQLSTRVAIEGHDEIAQLADSFNRSAQRIESLVSAQRSLLANASHELRSPLARIRMAIELLQQQAGAQPALREELTHNIEELDQLIEEILLSSRLDAQAEPSMHLETFDLTALVAEEAAQFDAALSAQPVVFFGDPKLLRRLLRNLLENAQRYGGRSSIAVSLTRLNATAVELDISDGGPGVPVGEREKIFEPFYRIPGASEREGGVGLGLSLVRQIARAHAGDVTCLSLPDDRTCFRVILPLRLA